MKGMLETFQVTTCRAWLAIATLTALAIAGQVSLASAQMGEGTEGRQWVAGPQQSKASPAQYQVIAEPINVLHRWILLKDLEVGIALRLHDDGAIQRARGRLRLLRRRRDAAFGYGDARARE